MGVNANAGDNEHPCESERRKNIKAETLLLPTTTVLELASSKLVTELLNGILDGFYGRTEGVVILLSSVLGHFCCSTQLLDNILKFRNFLV